MKKDNLVPKWATLPREKLCLFIIKGNNPLKIKAEVDGKPGYTLGRSPDCDIVCSEEGVSRVHAVLAHSQDGKTYIIDLNSKHGTFVDKRRLKPKEPTEILKYQSSILLGGEYGAELRLTSETSNSEHTNIGKRPTIDNNYDPFGDSTAVAASEYKEDFEKNNIFSNTLDFDPKDISRASISKPIINERFLKDLEELENIGKNDKNINISKMADDISNSGDKKEMENIDNLEDSILKGRVIKKENEGERLNRGRNHVDHDVSHHHHHHQSKKSGYRKRDCRSSPGHDRPSKKSHHREEGGSHEKSKDRYFQNRDNRNNRYHCANNRGRRDSYKNKVNTSENQGSGLTLEQKKQLLWGKKKEEAAVRWDVAEFRSEEERSKFQRLMGVKEQYELGGQKNEESSRKVLTGQEQEEVLRTVEKHFVAGLRRADGRTVGLGL